MVEESFAALLRRCRQAAGLSQRQLAERTGAGLATIRDLEQGRTRRPREQLAEALIAALGPDGEAVADALRHLAAGEPVAPPAPARHLAPDHPVRVGVLGALVVRRAGATVPVGGARPRAALGRLALSANAPVPPHDLFALLGEGEPAPAYIVQSCISRLRSALQPAGPGRDAIIALTPAGYRLNLADDQLDLTDFRGRVRRARDAEPGPALDLLESALALWRGGPLADLPGRRDHPLVTALTDERIAAALRHAELSLAAGRPERCLPTLRDLAAAHPLHEPLHARLIAALAAANLQAAALDAYADVRRRLVDELGIEPGPELAAAHRSVLRQEPAPAAAPAPPPAPRPPAQLPADVPGFAGRAAALGRLDAIVDGLRGTRDPAPAVVIAAVSGTAGIGKTALAVRWAHRVRSRFPDGQLYVNLRGFDPAGPPLTPDRALRGFLDALGVAAERVPADVDGQAALYRSLVADRRILVVLDNARDPDQVRPLLPGAAGCLALVTSRHQLAGLVALEGARPLPLGLLDAAESRQLLVSRLGAARIGAEPEAAREIVARCAGLPLALAIVAARAATNPHFPLSAVAEELRRSPAGLDAFSGEGGAADLRAVFSWSYRLLSPPAADLFRLLSLHPGPDAPELAAASLAGRPAADVRPLLAELARANLLTEHRPGRFTCHDLLRAYATELARTLEPDEQRAALHRLLDHYVHTAHAATTLLSPHRDPVTLDPPTAGAALHRPSSRTQALEWLDRERPALAALVELADGLGFDRHVRRLAWALTAYFARQGHGHEWIATQRAALRAALRSADLAGQADAHRSLVRAYGRLGRTPDVRRHFDEAVALYARLGDHTGEGHTRLNMAKFLHLVGRPEEALHENRRGFDLYRISGDRLGQAHALNSIGYTHGQLGDHASSLEHTRRALTILRQIGAETSEINTLDSMGHAYHHLGRYEEAVSCYTRAIALARRTGDRHNEAEILTHLGDAHHSTGRPEEARDCWLQALVILNDLAHPDATKVQAKLHALASPPLESPHANP